MRILLFICLFLLSNNLFSQEVIVEIYKKKYIPAEIIIEEGDIVIWKNIEKRQYHNVWFKQFDKEEPDYFFPDEAYQRSFKQAGVFLYECGPHPMMKGQVTVIKKE
ncbi:plastocyanin/azurin family copper-binding protein [Colwellia sp. MSW7]|jgi:plastocyanin|uniref:Plastocyanin/azurin family copper-binding protein n=1 Tax=Colwellia maritima TaxID=2912588 RepID=A0ABS9WYG0_9GAMM|nr:plastocyanin/azurin family copper-binding protein [Colwellia maritima]MCI2282970.1 plastocyanin/azurin family copper-binding protein [Colwellia maritima]